MSNVPKLSPLVVGISLFGVWIYFFIRDLFHSDLVTVQIKMFPRPSYDRVKVLTKTSEK